MSTAMLFESTAIRFFNDGLHLCRRIDRQQIIIIKVYELNMSIEYFIPSLHLLLVFSAHRTRYQQVSIKLSGAKVMVTITANSLFEFGMFQDVYNKIFDN